MVSWKKWNWLLLLYAVTLMGQSQPVQHCYFSELSISDDSSRLFFKSVYCEEGEPASSEPAWLALDRKNLSLEHLNPQPTRFVLSPDKSILLFTSRYGLFRMNLRKSKNWHQLVFWNPAQGAYLKQFGFLADNSGVGWTTVSSGGSSQSRALFWPKPGEPIPSAENAPLVDKLFLHSGTVQGPETVKAWRKFSASNHIGPIRLQQLSGKNIHQERLEIPFLGPLNPQILLNKIRPRLLSLNPDSSKLFISVLDSSYQARTFIFDVQSGKDLKRFDMGFNFMCWLDENQFIGLSADGLFRITLQPYRIEKMLTTAKELPNLTKTAKTDLYQIVTSKGHYRNSRIVQKTSDSVRTLVPEWYWQPPNTPTQPMP